MVRSMTHSLVLLPVCRLRVASDVGNSTTPSFPRNRGNSHSEKIISGPWRDRAQICQRHVHMASIPRHPHLRCIRPSSFLPLGASLPLPAP